MTTAIDWSRWVTFADQKLSERYSSRRMRMTTLARAYIAGQLDILDIDAFLDERRTLVTFDLLTIRKWHERWERHRDPIRAAYGKAWYRLWRLFLAWSWRIGAQGSSVCYQVVAHMNINSFPWTVAAPA